MKVSLTALLIVTIFGICDTFAASSVIVTGSGGSSTMCVETAPGIYACN